MSARSAVLPCNGVAESSRPALLLGDSSAGTRGTTLLGAAFLITWLLVVVDGIWVYVQIKLLGRKVLPLSLFVGPCLFASAAWYTAHRGRTIAPGALALPFWLLASYLPVAVLVHTGEGWTELGPAIHGLYVYYFFLLFLPLQWQARGALREQTVVIVMLLLGAGLAILGVAQHFRGDLFDVGRVVSEEAMAFNLSMNGHTRANALFAHSEDFGQFLALVGGVALAALLAARTAGARWALGLLLVLAAVGCYACYTRDYPTDLVHIEELVEAKGRRR